MDNINKDYIVEKGYTGYIEKSEDGVISYISVNVVDRDKEVVDPKGAILDNYRKNPVVLYNHNTNIPPIGKNLWIRTSEDGIVAKTQFASTEFAKDIQRLFEGGYLNAFSIRFIPLDWEEVTIREARAKGIKIPEAIGYSDDDVVRVYTKWELLEYSVVPIPANPEAVRLACVEGIVKSKQLIKDLGVDMDTIEKGATPYLDLPLNMDRSWDKNRAIRSLRVWAGGDKENIDWKKYRKGFMWYDEKNPENFGSYKLPYAEVINGKLTAIWRGVVAVMGAILGARGGVDIPDADRKKVYNHCAKYYKKAGKEPPEFKFYTEGELQKMFPELYEGDIENTEEKAGRRISKETAQKIREAINILQSLLDDTSQDTADEPKGDKTEYDPDAIRGVIREVLEEVFKV